MRVISHQDLANSDLVVDAIYQGTRRGTAADDPLPRLIGVSTGGGFRYRGSIDRLELVALTSSKSDPDWPDALDPETGTYTYFGDNKVPGRELHGTPRFGNRLLQRIFEDAAAGSTGRERVPPILVFRSAGDWRDVVFLGLAVPGVVGLPPAEHLVAVWRSREGQRFQNYKALFTILRTACLSRDWLATIIEGRPDGSLAPEAWTSWVKTGRVSPLLAPRTLQHRKRSEQLPKAADEIEIVRLVHSFFEKDPWAFERCAAELTRMMLPNVAGLDLTRRSRDGGRDGVGQYRVGTGASAILVDFALEAKCYSPSQSVGVREMSRLISRLRHRQFGVLVTTACVDEQAYKEIKEDQHPIVIIAAADIASLLKANGYGSPVAVRDWLEREFPMSL